MPREMTVEVGFVDADVLVGEHALVRLEFDHTVDQQERITMRQHRLDRSDVQRELQRAHHDSLSAALMRRVSASSCLKRAAFLRQLRLSINGVPDEYSPGSRIELVTRLMAVTTTLSQTSRCPRTPAPPPIRQ